MDFNPKHDFRPVFEAMNQQPTHTQNGWTYVPAVGTYGQGPSSHYTYNPQGQLDHYSTYNNTDRIKRY